VRKPLPLVAVLAAAAAAAALLSGPADAQNRWEWPDHSKNLKVLPEETDAQTLRSTMHDFTHALGVRCNYCHVGEEGKPFTEWDFAADDKAPKETARAMMRMLADVEEDLAKIEPSGERVTMECATCHRGAARPQRLEDALTETYREDGADAAIARYHELRDRAYGRGTYDFGEDGLNLLGYRMLGAEDVAGATKVFTLNTELFPESTMTWDSMAEVTLAAGDTTKAVQLYEKAFALEPRNRNAERMLKKLRGEE
jgi:tetratricopeptide (TPR) repeat protein